MAQLPPKIPIVLAQDHQHQQEDQHQHDEIGNQHEWPEFNEDGDQNPSWVDEFIEFSTAKRGAHRRARSDPSMEANEIEKGGGKQANDGDHEQFDKLDDDQLMSMFSTNEVGTSNHNYTNDDLKGTITRVGDKEEIERVRKQMDEKDREDEGDSTCMGNDGNERQEGISGRVEVNKDGYLRLASDEMSGDQQPVVDPKRIKRILANRQSAQRSRIRKLQYISELERSVTFLQSEVSALSPRVAFLDHQRMILNVDNSAIKAKIAALAQDKIFKDAQQDALKREIERLRQIYYHQSLKKTEETMTSPPSSSPLPSPAFQHPPYDELKDIENEQLIN